MDGFGEGWGRDRRRGSAAPHGTGTTRMVLVKPEPGRHPVSTITTSPFLKKPLALPMGRRRRRKLVSKWQAFTGEYI